MAGRDDRWPHFGHCVIIYLVGDEARGRAETAAGPRSVRLVPLPAAAMAALLKGDLAGGSAAAGVTLPGYFMTDDFLPVWRLRIDQLARDPGSAQWSAYAAVAEPEGVIVGHAGFHGPPSEAGMVEIGYSVDPAYRRQGYAKAMLRELLHRAAAGPAVTTVRAAISPGNTASLATIAGFGFTQVGEQWDEEDGLEILFEVAALKNAPG